MSDDDTERARLERKADVIRARLLRELDALSHKAPVEAAKAAPHAIKVWAPYVLGAAAALTLVGVALLVRRAFR